MTTLNVDIYHCQKCGRVASCECEQRAPECCGESMAQAITNIRYDESHHEMTPTKEVIAGRRQLHSSNRK
ncbi:MAG: hypothetical protein KDA84_23515 [Planctomycetaceae bacterium]|nr:hypothetical protein [Planctomycetaceae bacterium]